jgi:hypothetical protein
MNRSIVTTGPPRIAMLCPPLTIEWIPGAAPSAANLDECGTDRDDDRSVPIGAPEIGPGRGHPLQGHRSRMPIPVASNADDRQLWRDPLEPE